MKTHIKIYVIDKKTHIKNKKTSVIDKNTTKKTM